MGLLELILYLALIGVIVYLIVTFIPMPPAFRTVIMVIAAIFVILMLMRAVGFQDVPVPRLR